MSSERSAFELARLLALRLALRLAIVAIVALASRPVVAAKEVPAECRAPVAPVEDAEANVEAPAVRRVDPRSAAVRAAANAARRAVLAGDPDAARRIEAAFEAVRALPEESADRLPILLHVLRSRMIGLERSALAKNGEVLGEQGRAPIGREELAAEREALARELARLATSAQARGENGPRAWAQVYRAELALAGGRRADALSLVDVVQRVPEEDATWEALVAAEGVRERALLARTSGPMPTSATAPAADRAEAIRGLERARRILARVRPRIDRTLFLERARPIHERLAALRLAESKPMEERAKAALEVLEALKLAELRAYYGDACLAELAPTSPEAEPGTVLLYPAILGEQVELIVGRAGRWSHRPAKLTADALIGEARKLRGALQDPTSPRFRSAAAQLYEALVRPIEAELDALRRGGDGGAATLVIVPSGVLRTIPFAALLDAKTGRFLIEDVALATLPSLQLLPAAPLDARRMRLLAVGLTEGVDGFSPLPFAERELEAASRRFPGLRRIDAGFSKAGFAEALGSEPFDVVHVASHGRFDARASESFLLAHDGRIGIAALDELVGATRHRTGRPLELLVLSACETAIGDERASLGLAGVAVQAGARSAIASLWKVHDEATMRLFDVFYRELGRPGVSRAEALRRAQRALLEEPRFRHPIFWSAFLLVSGWR